MPEKKNGGFKKIFEEYIADYLREIVRFFFSMLERHLKRYAVSLVVMIASLSVIIYGIGSFLGYFFPAWPSGISHIFVGLFFLLAAKEYSKR